MDGDAATRTRTGLPSYLGVTKRHRPDKFLLTHAVDGFSLAMDFKVTDGNRAKLRAMLQDFDQIVLESRRTILFRQEQRNHRRNRARILWTGDSG